MSVFHYDVGTLIQFALQPRLRPASTPRYRELLERMHVDSDFFAAVRDTASGLGLEIVEHNDTLGLYLSPDENSTFAMTPSAFRSSRPAVDDQLVDALIQIGVAAIVFPRPEDLDGSLAGQSPAPPPFTLEDVDARIRTMAEQILTEHQSRDEDGSAEQENLAEAARLYLDTPFIIETPTGRFSSKCAYRIIQSALEELVEHGMMSQLDDDRFRALYRYVSHMRNGGADRLLQMAYAFDAPEMSEEQHA